MPTCEMVRTTSSPSSPPYSAAGGSNSRTSGSRGIAAAGMYGGLEMTTSTLPSRSGSASARSMKTARALAAPVSSMFLRAQMNASGEFSTAKTRACGTSVAIARAMAPLPVPRSTATGSALGTARSASMANCTTCSVSGRGTNTPGPTASSRERNGARPVMCWSGSRAARRSPSSRMRSASAPSIGAVHVDEGLHAPAPLAEDMPDQELGVDLGVGDAGTEEDGRELVAHGADGERTGRRGGRGFG